MHIVDINITDFGFVYSCLLLLDHIKQQ